jgi:hypothetical protein
MWTHLPAKRMTWARAMHGGHAGGEDHRRARGPARRAWRASEAQCASGGRCYQPPWFDHFPSHPQSGASSCCPQAACLVGEALRALPARAISAWLRSVGPARRTTSCRDGCSHAPEPAGVRSSDGRVLVPALKAEGPELAGVWAQRRCCFERLIKRMWRPCRVQGDGERAGAASGRGGTAQR